MKWYYVKELMFLKNKKLLFLLPFLFAGALILSTPFILTGCGTSGSSEGSYSSSSVVDSEELEKRNKIISNINSLDNYQLDMWRNFIRTNYTIDKDTKARLFYYQAEGGVLDTYKMDKKAYHLGKERMTKDMRSTYLLKNGAKESGMSIDEFINYINKQEGTFVDKENGTYGYYEEGIKDYSRYAINSTHYYNPKTHTYSMQPDWYSVNDFGFYNNNLSDWLATMIIEKGTCDESLNTFEYTFLESDQYELSLNTDIPLPIKSAKVVVENDYPVSFHYYYDDLKLYINLLENDSVLKSLDFYISNVGKVKVDISSDYNIDEISLYRNASNNKGHCLHGTVFSKDVYPLKEHHYNDRRFCEECGHFESFYYDAFTTYKSSEEIKVYLDKDQTNPFYPIVYKTSSKGDNFSVYMFNPTFNGSGVNNLCPEYLNSGIYIGYSYLIQKVTKSTTKHLVESEYRLFKNVDPDKVDITNYVKTHQPDFTMSGFEYIYQEH